MGGLAKRVTGALERVAPVLDRAATAISPRWGAHRMRDRMAIGAFSRASESGYVVPGSQRKSMKGVRATANSPDDDTISRMSGMRALSRDLYMNAPLAASILQRHQTLNIGSGLQVQSVIDREVLGLSVDEAEARERELEREFDLWAESTSADFEGMLCFGELQALGYFNLLLNGDFFFIPVWRESPEQDFPYKLCIKLIDADLVRNPVDVPDGVLSGQQKIQGGVEKDGSGRVVAYHIWNTYPHEWIVGKGVGQSKRIPVYDGTGRQQIFHVFDPKRISQRRGVPLLANVADSLKQLTRLSEAELMGALVRSFFTVFVRDASGMGATLGPALTPEEVVAGGGRYGPDLPEVGSRNEEDGNDLEMGHGNVIDLDDKKDVTLADPGKTDKDFAKFWDALAIQVCAGGNIPVEQAVMHYTTSYTAARAAANDVWRYRQTARTLMARRMNQPVYLEWMTEASMRGRVSVPGFFDDYATKRAWSRTQWVGPGQGSLNPLQEAKADVVHLNSKTTTREEIYQQNQGGRWETMLDKLEREERKIGAAGLHDEPDPNEIIGPDGQKDEPEDEENEVSQNI